MPPEVKSWLAEYEAKYGRRGTSDVTTDKVPLAQTCGPARVIDVTAPPRHDRPARAGRPRRRSPSDDIRRDEEQHGELAAGRHRHLPERLERPILPARSPRARRCMDDPLNGRSEGWPAPGPEAIVYLAKQGNPLRGHRCPDAGRRRARSGRS